MKRQFVLFLVVALIVVAIWALGGFGGKRVNTEIIPVGMTVEEKEGQYPKAKELVGIEGYINTNEGFLLSGIIGEKVVLLDFWTYSCINCQRTTPYLNAWYDKYRDQGLEIVGVHTPEFEFEKEIENVKTAVANFGIEYPVVQDNEYQTWTAYGNRYWPRKYLIDTDGYIVYDHIGEGGYDKTEEIIQILLRERAHRFGENLSFDSGNVNPENVKKVESNKITPEIYFGSLRNESLGNGEPGRSGQFNLEIPNDLNENHVYLSGSWQIEPEYSKSLGQGSIIINYYGKDVYMVARSDSAVELEILLDGEQIGDRAGADVMVGILKVEEDRLYEIVSDTEYGRHRLEIKIMSPGLEAYTFTFG